MFFKNQNIITEYNNVGNMTLGKGPFPSNCDKYKINYNCVYY